MIQNFAKQMCSQLRFKQSRHIRPVGRCHRLCALVRILCDRNGRVSVIFIGHREPQVLWRHTGALGERRRVPDVQHGVRRHVHVPRDRNVVPNPKQVACIRSILVSDIDGAFLTPKRLHTLPAVTVLVSIGHHDCARLGQQMGEGGQD